MYQLKRTEKMNERNAAIDIANETRNLFPIGCVVEDRRRTKIKIGVVQGYGMGGNARYGFAALSCLRVRWGNNKTTATIHRDFIERTGESK